MLFTALRESIPLSRVMLQQTIAEQARTDSLDNALRVVGAANPTSWDRAIAQLSNATGEPATKIAAELAKHLGLHATNASASTRTNARVERPMFPPDTDRAPAHGPATEIPASGPDR